MQTSLYHPPTHTLISPQQHHIDMNPYRHHHDHHHHQHPRYLLTHADNVTLCGSDGGVHVGDGECASPVPTCESPGVPDEGEMVLSSPYILPGTTATYTCPNAGTFLQGPPLRTCTQGTSENKKNHFDGADPKCTVTPLPPPRVHGRADHWAHAVFVFANVGH